jgi:hypothetical protein
MYLNIIFLGQQKKRGNTGDYFEEKDKFGGDFF